MVIFNSYVKLPEGIYFVFLSMEPVIFQRVSCWKNVRLTPQGHASACCLIRVCLKMGYTPKSLNLLIIYIDLWSFHQLTVPFLYIFMASPHLSHPSWCKYLLSRSTPTSSLRCQWCSAGRMDTASYRHTWKNRGHLRCCETLADPKVGTKSSS